MEEVQSQLALLIQEGDSISVKIQQKIGQLNLISLGKLAAYFMLEDDDWNTLQDIERYVRELNLPAPIQDIYTSYVVWNRKCDSLFHKLQWQRDPRVVEFGTSRKEFGKEISRQQPRLSMLNVSRRSGGYTEVASSATP